MYLPGVYLVCSTFLYLTSHWVHPVEALIPLVEVPSKLVEASKRHFKRYVEAAT